MSRRLPLPADLGVLSGCAAGLAQAFVSLSSDIALVIDDSGIVTSVTQHPDAPMNPAAARWVGQPWAQTVTGDTRCKIERLLADAHSSGLGRRREVNHASTLGTDLPVAYTALRLGAHGPVLAVGRDLRSVAAIQQRFLETQAALERSYWRARHDDIRYRLLYQVASDAVATVCATTLQLLDMNPAAVALLYPDGDGPRLQAHTETSAAEAAAASNGPLLPHFDARSRPTVQALLSHALAQGRPAEGPARLAGSHLSVALVVTRCMPAPGSPNSPRLLLRMRQADPTESLPDLSSDQPPTVGTPLSRHVDATPTGLVVTDAQGRVREANLAFVQMVQADSADAVLGQPLSAWLAGAGDELVMDVQQQGLLRSRRIHLHRHRGMALLVNAAGALLADVEAGCAGYTLQPCGSDALTAGVRAAALAQAIEVLSSELGQAPLPELLRRALALTQAHLVHSALDCQGGDAAAAARLLNVSGGQLARMQLDPAFTATPPSPLIHRP